MDKLNERTRRVDRRRFLGTAGGGLAAAGLILTPAGAAAQAMSDTDKLDRIASNSYPFRSLFKTRPRGGSGGSGRANTPAAQVPGRGMGGVTPEGMKAKHGEITLLDFPQFTRDTLPGVTHLDVWSSLFGDVADDSMYGPRGFDPSTPSSRKWLDRLAGQLAKTGTAVHHISNNAPTGMSGPEEEARQAGLDVARKWLDAAAVLGAKTMRVNSGGPTFLPAAVRGPDGYPKNEEIEPYLRTCIESFKAMADYGAKRNVKVTLENHWGLTANPANMCIILDGVNHPFCEASPDFANWEHESMIFSGLKIVAPYTHTTVHAKYWDRWTSNDLQRSTRIMRDSGFTGKFALEYESGPWEPVEGVRHMLKEVLAGLSSPPTPA